MLCEKDIKRLGMFSSLCWISLFLSSAFTRNRGEIDEIVVVAFVVALSGVLQMHFFVLSLHGYADQNTTFLSLDNAW